MPTRQFGVALASMQEIESEFGLQEQLVPDVQGVVSICAAGPSNRVVFECADGRFSCIATVHIW